MKEVKWMLYTVYVVLNTSLFWETYFLSGIRIGTFRVGLIFPLLLIAFTLYDVIIIVYYLREHWDN